VFSKPLWTGLRVCVCARRRQVTLPVWLALEGTSPSLPLQVSGPPLIGRCRAHGKSSARLGKAASHRSGHCDTWNAGVRLIGLHCCLYCQDKDFRLVVSWCFKLSWSVYFLEKLLIRSGENVLEMSLIWQCNFCSFLAKRQRRNWIFIPNRSLFISGRPTKLTIAHD